METKQIQVTDEMRAAGVLAVTVNELSPAEKAAADDKALLAEVELEARRLRIHYLAEAMIDGLQEDFEATLARISK